MGGVTLGVAVVCLPLTGCTSDVGGGGGQAGGGRNLRPDLVREVGGGGGGGVKNVEKITPPSFLDQFELCRGKNCMRRLCTGPFTVSHNWWKQSFCVFGTGFDRPSARLQTAKSVLSYPSGHILSQHPHSHPLEWGHRGRQNCQHSKNG